MSSLDSSVEFSLTRVFNAPRALVFATMTETAHLAKWWGPAGCTIEVARHTPQPGGEFLYRMVFPGGFGMWGKFQYQEITPPERIVWINSFADEHGATARNPMAADWPLEMLNTVTLSEQDGKTVLHVRSRPYQASAAEEKVFLAGHASMQQGFGGMYDVYETYLASL